MTSVLKSFLRRDSVPEGRTDYNRSTSGLASSPSFNDFSMGLNVCEADTELTSEASCTPTPRTPGWLARLSCDSQASAQSQASIFSGLESPYARSPHAAFATPFQSHPSPAQQLEAEAGFRQRCSMDSQLSYGRPAPSGIANRAPYKRSNSLAIPARHVSVPHPTQAAAAAQPSRREGKIDGMDYYEFCELIRSSSL